MRYTLLEMTQTILSSLDSDEVNTISETVESDQVAKIIKSCYYDMATELGLPEHHTAFQLNASGDVDKPCLMSCPSNVTRIDQIQYDVKDDGDTYPNYKRIEFLPFDEFMRRSMSLRSNDSGIGSMIVAHNGENFTFIYKNNVHPTYYTTCDDQQIIFDSYDSDVDTTLQKSKTMCFGTVYPTWTMEDGFYPDLDPTQFSLLINKSKVRAFNELKQVDPPEANREMRKQRIMVQKRMHKVSTGSPLNATPNYGRR